jgi:hypothetical protein
MADSKHTKSPHRSQRADPKEMAAKMLAAVEARDRPIIETLDSSGTVTWAATKPPIQHQREGWIGGVVDGGARYDIRVSEGQYFLEMVSQLERKSGRPERDIQDQIELGRAINRAVRRRGRSKKRSYRAITRQLREDAPNYRALPFETLRKQVTDVIDRFASVWDLRDLYDLVRLEQPVGRDPELWRELGLQSLQFLERPFGGSIFDNR